MLDLESLARRIDAGTAQAFVRAARHVLDALMVDAERVRAVQTPPPRDYDAVELPRGTPAGGWLGHEELRATAVQLAEAIAAEKWTDGLVFALRLLGGLGGLA